MKYALSKAQFAVDVSLPILSIIAVALRFIARRKKHTPPVCHDWIILTALLLTIGTCAAGIYVDLNDIFGITQQYMTPKEWELHQKFLFADVLLCHTIYMLIKISILLFYVSIFSTPKFKLSVRIMIGLVVSWWIQATLCHIFSGRPVASYWTVYLPWIRPGMDYLLWLTVTAGLDIALDLVTLCLPLFVIRKLHMRMVRKIQLICIFGLGAFCVVSSVIRFYWAYELYLLFHGRLSPLKITEIVTENAIWSHVEANTSIIAACMPTLMPLFASRRSFEALADSLYSFMRQIRSRLRTAVRRSSYSKSGRGSGSDDGAKGGQTPTENERVGGRRWYQIGQSVLPTRGETMVLPGPSMFDNTVEDEDDKTIVVKTRISACSLETGARREIAD